MSENQYENMTRQEAVSAIVSTWYQRDGEFCVGRDEVEDSVRELHAALRVLGVTDEEINA